MRMDTPLEHAYGVRVIVPMYRWENYSSYRDDLFNMDEMHECNEKAEACLTFQIHAFDVRLLVLPHKMTSDMQHLLWDPTSYCRC